MNDGGANRNGKVQGSVKAEVADGTRIDVPAIGLELVDDFHRAYFGTPGNGAARKGCLDEIDAVLVLGQHPFHDRHQVVDIFVGLDGFMRPYPDRSTLAGAADVVAQQIDDHGQLGIVFGAGHQLFPHGLVLAGIVPAGPGALDGPGFNMLAVQSQESLRRSRDQVMVAGVHEREKRRRVFLVQGPEKSESTSLEPCFKALGQVHLIDVSGGDIVANALDGGFVVGPVKIGLQSAMVHRKVFFRQGGVPKCGHPVAAIRCQLLVTFAAHDFVQVGLLLLFVVNNDDRRRIEAQVRQLPAIQRGAREFLQNIFQIVGQIAHQTGRQRG